MADGRNIKVSGLDFGALAGALVLVAWLAINAWNWNSAREDCATVLADRSADSRTVGGEDVRECAEELLDED